jgi:hypothetical protein
MLGKCVGFAIRNGSPRFSNSRSQPGIDRYPGCAPDSSGENSDDQNFKRRHQLRLL